MQHNGAQMFGAEVRPDYQTKFGAAQCSFLLCCCNTIVGERYSPQLNCDSVHPVRLYLSCCRPWGVASCQAWHLPMLFAPIRQKKARLSVSTWSRETGVSLGLVRLVLVSFRSRFFFSFGSQSRIFPSYWYWSQSQSRILANSGLSITIMTIKYSEMSIFFTLSYSRWWQEFWSSKNSLGLIILVAVSWY